MSETMPNLSLVERLRCPACHAPTTAPFLSLPFDSDPLRAYLLAFYDSKLDPSVLANDRFELCACGSCSLVYQRRVPDDSSLAVLYGTLAVSDPTAMWARRTLDERIGYLHSIERVVRFLGVAPSRVDVLDYGAGTGLWLQMAAALGCRTTAVELDAAVVERLAAAGHAVASPDTLGVEAFDFINAEQVFEHLIEPAHVVASMAKALKPGGLLRLSVPNGTEIMKLIAMGDWSAPKDSPRSLNAVAPLEHVNCFNYRSLVRLGTDAGLDEFRFPLRSEIHPTARIRHAASATVHRIRKPRGTMLYFRRPQHDH